MACSLRAVYPEKPVAGLECRLQVLILGVGFDDILSV